MIGKSHMIGILAIFAATFTIFSLFAYIGYSAEYQTGSTTMNVTIRGYVSISVSNCLTNGISFATKDPNTNNNNATCNNITTNGGTGYNLTVDPSSTVSINFTHATNRTNLTDGVNTISIDANLTYHSNSTANNASNLKDAATSTALSNSWKAMENCTSLTDSDNCWSTYFLDIPLNQAPGNYWTGYCWCGRQTGTAEGNCGTCT